MIIFEGELTNKSKSFLQRKSFEYLLCSLIAPLILLGFLFVYFAISFSNLIFIFVYLLICALFVVITYIYTHSNEEQKENNIRSIRIEYNELTVIKDGKITSQTKEFDDIKEIYDMGEFYWINFYLPKSMYFLCQKNLVKSGSIEEFESLFKDKIVRKSQ